MPRPCQPVCVAALATRAVVTTNPGEGEGGASQSVLPWVSVRRGRRATRCVRAHARPPAARRPPTVCETGNDTGPNVRCATPAGHKRGARRRAHRAAARCPRRPGRPPPPPRPPPPAGTAPGSAPCRASVAPQAPRPAAAAPPASSRPPAAPGAACRPHRARPGTSPECPLCLTPLRLPRRRRARARAANLVAQGGGEELGAARAPAVKHHCHRPAARHGPARGGVRARGGGGWRLREHAEQRAAPGAQRGRCLIERRALRQEQPRDLPCAVV